MFRRKKKEKKSKQKEDDKNSVVSNVDSTTSSKDNASSNSTTQNNNKSNNPASDDSNANNGSDTPITSSNSNTSSSTTSSKDSSNNTTSAKSNKSNTSAGNNSTTTGKVEQEKSLVSRVLSTMSISSKPPTVPPATATSSSSEEKTNATKSKKDLSSMLTDNNTTTAATTATTTITTKDSFKKGISHNDVNYDVNPTLLYKFIEYRDWSETLDRIKANPSESKTWVYRLEDVHQRSYEDEENNVNGGGDVGSKSSSASEINIRWRMLPIHVAVIFNAPIKVIMALHKAYPSGIMECDDRKMLPIHLACRVVSNLSVVQFLIYKSTESLTCLDYKGRKPIEILKEYSGKNRSGNARVDRKELKNRESLIRLMEEKLEGGNDGALLNDVSVYDEESGEGESESESEEEDEKEEEEEEEPEIPKETEKKLSPVRKRSAKFLKSMKLQRTQIPKETSKEVDYDTYPTVLIKLIERKNWEEAITRCVEVPQEASTWMCRLQEVNSKKSGKNEVRWKILPIHSAIVLHAPVEVIEALVEAFPEGLQRGDDRQMLPLHMAFRLGSSPETAAVLVDAFPGALKKRDSRGHTPLHILKAYRRKYIKERENGKASSTEMDINRKKLIKFYIGGRKYGYSEDGLDRDNKFDSDSDSSSESSDEDSYYDSDDEEGLFYNDMFSDFARLTSKGISSFPIIMRDTLACRGGSYDLGA